MLNPSTSYARTENTFNANAEPQAIYGSIDTRTNLFAVDRLNLDPQLIQTIRGQAKCVGVLMHKSWLNLKLDRSGYRLSSRTSTLEQSFRRKRVAPLAGDQRFRHEPDVGFGTAFLIGDQIALTAGHCVCGRDSFTLDENMIQNTRLVFGYQMTNSDTCNRDFSNENIFRIEVVAHQFFRNRAGEWIDWALLKLEKKVSGLTPLSIDTQPARDQIPLYMLGYPSGLPLKLSMNGEVGANTNSNYFRSDLDSFGGNSGSPIFNATTGTVVGILVGGPREEYEISEGNLPLARVRHYPSDPTDRSHIGNVCQRVNTLEFMNISLPYLERPIAPLSFGNPGIGLNIGGFCKSTTCAALNQLVYAPKGIGVFSLSIECSTSKCTACQTSFHPDDVNTVFLKGSCQYQVIKGMDPQRNLFSTERFTILRDTLLSFEIENWCFLRLAVYS